jgi:hypothetical protein
MKVLTTELLVAANVTAVKRNYNRSLTQEFLKTLDPDGLHLIRFAMPHNDGEEFRCEILCKQEDTIEPAAVFLDVDPDLFDRLPDHEELERR